MPKVSPAVVFEDHDKLDYFVKATFTQDRRAFKTLVLAIPGFSGDVHPAARVPIECVDIAARLFRKLGYRVVDRRCAPSHRSVPPLATRLSHPVAHPYQIQLAERFLRERVLLGAHEMGLGKCLATILALRFLNDPATLIVCPANVRIVWEDELDKWWPEHPDVFIADTGKKASSCEAADASILITSYGLVGKVPQKGWEAIVLDEFHYCANAIQGGRPVQRSVKTRRLLDENRSSYIWALTGTPITNEPINLHNQIDTLWPGRMGRFWDFAHHYCNVEATDYTDCWIHGVNIAYAKELTERLMWMVDRRTKNEPEVARYMPPFQCTPMRVKAKRNFKPRELWASLNRVDFHREKAAAEAVIRSCGVQKIDAAVEWAADATKMGQKVTVLTYLKQTAKDIEAKLRVEHVPVWRFDGDRPVRQREILIRTALTSPDPGALVCTMGSVKEGINSLAGFDNALFAELYYTPGVMKQALMRFWRAHASCDVRILFVEGSHEEVIAMRLTEKIKAETHLLKADKTGKLLTGALDQDEDEETEIAKLRSVAAQRVAEDVY